MSLHEPDDQEEKPLDPVMENVRRKMIKLQLVSAGVMVVMLMAVLGAIVYKVTRTSTPAVAQPGMLAVPSDAPLSAAVALPPGFEIAQVSLSGSQMLFYGTLADGARKALVVDVATGRIVAELAISNP